MTAARSKKDKPRNTVKDLRRALRGLPDDAVVVLEGCDCYGNWNGETQRQTGAVLLCRSS